jgi:hypothetical protein
VINTFIVCCTHFRLFRDTCQGLRFDPLRRQKIVFVQIQLVQLLTKRPGPLALSRDSQIRVGVVEVVDLNSLGSFIVCHLLKLLSLLILV